MSLSVPEWLARHGGDLRLSTDGHTWVVYVDNQPLYELAPVPVAGKHGCQVTQTINGRRLDRGAAFATEEDALRGGLENLRTALGW
jgi:hypothetical protein